MNWIDGKNPSHQFPSSAPDSKLALIPEPLCLSRTLQQLRMGLRGPQWSAAWTISEALQYVLVRTWIEKQTRCKNKKIKKSSSLSCPGRKTKIGTKKSFGQCVYWKLLIIWLLQAKKHTHFTVGINLAHNKWNKMWRNFPSFSGAVCHEATLVVNAYDHVRGLQ